ncbi:MAG: GNAT family N-acetyltransferase [Calditrichaceae bacterium]
MAPLIETKRLILKALSRGDASLMYSYRSDPEVTRYQSWHPASEHEAESFIIETNKTDFNTVDTWFQLGVYLKSTGELIGDIGIHFLAPDNRQAEIGFTIAPKHQRKGYATEAVAQVFRLNQNLPIEFVV